MLALIGPLGTWEVIIILVIALLIFGPRLPQIARSMGKSLVEFKKGLHEVDEAAEDVKKDVSKAGEKPPESKSDGNDQNLAG